MNKHHRNQHLAIRNIQRTNRFGRMTYREARRKYKAGYRAIPVGRGCCTTWLLLNFGADDLTLAQVRKLGEEYTLIAEHAERAGFKATMRYDFDMHCLMFKYQGLSNTWRLALSLDIIALMIDGDRLAECIRRSAEHSIPDLRQCDDVASWYPYTGISRYSYDEDFNEIVSHSIRDRAQGVSSLLQTYRSATLPIFGGYSITKTDR